jgi:hypothetical protein
MLNGGNAFCAKSARLSMHWPKQQPKADPNRIANFHPPAFRPEESVV